MPSSSFIVFPFSLCGFQHSGVCKVELVCWAGKKARLTGLLETYEDFPQKIKYVSFSGFIAEVKDVKPFRARAGQCVGHTGQDQLPGCTG